MSREKWIYVHDVNVRAANETEHSYITGMDMLSDTELIIIDQNNKSVKLVDVAHDCILGCLKFETIPYSITVISKNMVSVTFPNISLVRLLSTSGRLAIHRALNVNGFCVATTYNDGKLYVSYRNPVKFEILNKDGSVAAVITMDEPSLKLYEIPRYFTISSDRGRIYVTDLTRDVILCTDIDGKLINSYKEEDLEKPHAITMATSSGDVYVSNRNRHIVYKYDENLNKAIPILCKSDGLKYPAAICLSSSDKSLYISSASTKPEVKNFVRKYSFVRVFDIESYR